MSIPLPMRFEQEPLLWTVEDVYTPQECADFIDFIERSAPKLATNNPVYRNQDCVMHDDPKAASDLFRRLKPYLPETIGPFQIIGLNDRLRLYRYKPGQRFSPHMDHWYRPSRTQITLHTVLIYFNGDFKGGETLFMEQLDQIIVPKPGLAAVFQHKIRHEGRPVLSGTKYALRTDIIFEAPDTIGEVSF